MISQYQFLHVQAKLDVKSVREDDASVPVHLWDYRLLYNYPVPSVLEVKYRQYLYTALNNYRNFILRLWFQYIYSSFVQYLQNQWTIGTQLYLDLDGPLDTAESSSE